jgi:hypothetical protein
MGDIAQPVQPSIPEAAPMPALAHRASYDDESGGYAHHL